MSNLALRIFRITGQHPAFAMLTRMEKSVFVRADASESIQLGAESSGPQSGTRRPDVRETFQTSNFECAVGTTLHSFKFLSPPGEQPQSVAWEREDPVLSTSCLWGRYAQAEFIRTAQAAEQAIPPKNAAGDANVTNMQTGCHWRSSATALPRSSWVGRSLRASASPDTMLRRP